MITTRPAMHYRSNGCDPNMLSPDERLNEAASILARGILRLRARNAAKIGRSENISLDNSPNQWPHVSEEVEPFGERP